MSVNPCIYTRDREASPLNPHKIPISNTPKECLLPHGGQLRTSHEKEKRTGQDMLYKKNLQYHKKAKKSESKADAIKVDSI